MVGTVPKTYQNCWNYARTVKKVNSQKNLRKFSENSQKPSFLQDISVFRALSRILYQAIIFLKTRTNRECVTSISKIESNHYALNYSLYLNTGSEMPLRLPATRHSNLFFFFWTCFSFFSSKTLSFPHIEQAPKMSLWRPYYFKEVYL